MMFILLLFVCYIGFFVLLGWIFSKGESTGRTGRARNAIRRGMRR